jgi:hypothetical protein
MNLLIEDINKNINKKYDGDKKINLNKINNINHNLNYHEYQNYISDSYTKSIIQWIMKNNCHTFPIKKKRWLKTIESTKPLKKTNRLLNPFKTLKLFYNNEQIPYCFKDIKKCINRKINKEKKLFNRKRLFKFVGNLKDIFKLYFDEDPEIILNFCIDNNVLVPNERGNKLFVNTKLIEYMKQNEDNKRKYSNSLSHNDLMNLLNEDMKKMCI